MIGINGLLFAALQNNDIEKLKKYINNGFNLEQDPILVINQLIPCKDINFFKYIKEQDFDLMQDDYKLLKKHIEKRNEEIVSFLVTDVFLPHDIKKQCFEMSLMQDSIKMTKLFRKEIDISFNVENYFLKVTQRGHLESLQYLVLEEKFDPFKSKSGLTIDEIDDKRIKEWLLQYKKEKELKQLKSELNQKLVEKEITKEKKTKI